MRRYNIARKTLNMKGEKKGHSIYMDISSRWGHRQGARFRLVKLNQGAYVNSYSPSSQVVRIGKNKWKWEGTNRDTNTDTNTETGKGTYQE